jgi:hypothetical protein
MSFLRDGRRDDQVEVPFTETLGGLIRGWRSRRRVMSIVKERAAPRVARFTKETADGKYLGSTGVSREDRGYTASCGFHAA